MLVTHGSGKAGNQQTVGLCGQRYRNSLFLSYNRCRPALVRVSRDGGDNLHQPFWCKAADDIFEFSRGRSSDPNPSDTRRNLLTLYPEDANVGIIWWRDIEIRLNLSTSGGGDRVPLSSSFLLINPKILAGFARSAAAALSPLSKVGLWIGG